MTIGRFSKRLWRTPILAIAVLLSLQRVLLLVPSSSSSSSTTQQQQQQQQKQTSPIKQNPPYQLRDISKYHVSEWLDDDEVDEPHDPETEKKQSPWEQCLRFQCTRYDSTMASKEQKQQRCDNFDETNFDGPDPPCCVHLLRDMAREFDRIMVEELRLEYWVSFGTLLGLTRSDRFIPWTSDNDYLVTKQTLMAIKDLWNSNSNSNSNSSNSNNNNNNNNNESNHGLRLLFWKIYRLCITSSFADGKILRWQKEESVVSPITTTNRYVKNHPYIDFYWATENGTRFYDQNDCPYDTDLLRPMIRTPVYNASFYQNFPNRPKHILARLYGKSWRVPDANKNSHGGTSCKSTTRSPGRGWR